MVSEVEQMAANTSWSALKKATDFRQRVVFTIGVLIVTRIGTFIPVPGIDGAELQNFMQEASQSIGGMLSMFTGGALGRMGIFALGIMPYITASIIVQLLGSMVPAMEHLKKSGEQGQIKINQYTRYGTVALATVQSYGLAASLVSGGLVQPDIPVPFFYATCVVTLVGGTMFLMWLGEQITARGIGSGISLIIFVGIIAELPVALAGFLSQGRSGALSPAVVIIVIVTVVSVIGIVVAFERAQRKVPIQYPRRQVGAKVYEGGRSHLAVKVNPAGVIPAIFASSLLLLPNTIATFSGNQSSPFMSSVMAYFGPGQPAYMAFFAAMIVFFTYFYTFNVAFKPEEVAENLKLQNGFVPGIRPGAKTEEYLDYVVTRVTVLGATYLMLICLLPEVLRNELAVPFYFGGTSVLIVVVVTMDTIQRIQSHLIAHQYEGLLQKSQLGGKRRKHARRRGANRK